MTFMDPFPRGTRISQEFRASPGGYNPPGGHTGRDYAVPAGTPVRAAADGIIRHSSWLGRNYRANPWWLTDFGGDTLVLDCTDAFGNTDTMPTFIYAHLANSIADVGQRVKKGQVIGISGNTGTATSGPHCHVERLNPGFDLNNSVYGRSPLDFDEYFLDSNGIAPLGTTTKEDDMPSAKDVASELLNTPVDEVRPGIKNTLRELIAEYRTHVLGTHNGIISVNAQLKGLVGALSAVSKGEPFDEAKLLAGVQAAAAAGVKDAIESIDTTVTVKAGK